MCIVEVQGLRQIDPRGGTVPDKQNETRNRRSRIPEEGETDREEDVVDFGYGVEDGCDGET